MTTPPQSPIPIVGASSVEAVLLVELFTRTKPDHRFVSSSLPGHLIQCTIEGMTDHEANGRQYKLGVGDVIWYHEDEQVKGAVRKAPWSFYSVNFIAPTLSPPPFEARVQRVGTNVIRKFEALHSTWRDLSAHPSVREMRVHARLMELIADLSDPSNAPIHMSPAAQLWWETETLIRRDLSRPYSLPLLEKLSGRSQATIARSCFHALGISPMKRVLQIRLSLARGLVQRSDLSMKEIAARVAFTRIHEFSRAYRKHFGLPPSQDRQTF